MNEWNFVNLKDWKIYYPMCYVKKTNSSCELRLIKMFLHCFDEKSHGEVSLCNILFKLWFEFWWTKIFFNSFFFLKYFLNSQKEKLITLSPSCHGCHEFCFTIENVKRRVDLMNSEQFVYLSINQNRAQQCYKNSKK